MSKIAMFGGSFNPVHLGHTGLVGRMIQKFKLDRVYIVPTFNTPLKDNTPMLSPKHRYNMCSLAFSKIKEAFVSDMEIKRKGKSYTVDTIKQLQNIHPDCEIYLIIGADSFLQLPLWHNSNEIFSMVNILTVSRGEYDAEILYKVRTEYEKLYNAKISIVDEPIAPISSTYIRNAISNGDDYTHLLCEKVSDYIIANGLYL